MQIQKRHHNLHLDEDRFFDSDPSIRRAARAIYEQTRELPLLCPHGHVDAAILAENRPFPEPTELLIVPDHYIFRMLYSRGIPLEKLGIPRSDGARADVDPKDVWQTFAENWYLFRGTPTGAWLEHELQDLFDVRAKLDGSTASEIYDQIASKLRTPSFLPRALFERFGIEVPRDYRRSVRSSGKSSCNS
jgi:glucuronate isomerase